MNCQGSNFPQLLKGISFLMQDKGFLDVGLVVVGGMLSAHSGFFHNKPEDTAATSLLSKDYGVG